MYHKSATEVGGTGAARSRRRTATAFAAAILATGSLLVTASAPASAATYRYPSGISCQQVPGSNGYQTVTAFFVQRSGWTIQQLTVKNLSTNAETTSAWYHVYNRVAYHRWDYDHWTPVRTTGVASSQPAFNKYTQVARVHAPHSSYADYYVGSDACWT